MHLSSSSSLVEAEPEILLHTCTCISVAVCRSTRTDSLKQTTSTTTAPALVEPWRVWCAIKAQKKNFGARGDSHLSYLKRHELCIAHRTYKITLEVGFKAVEYSPTSIIRTLIIRTSWLSERLHAVQSQQCNNILY